jgi:hypothetical protein
MKVVDWCIKQLLTEERIVRGEALPQFTTYDAGRKVGSVLGKLR